MDLDPAAITHSIVLSTLEDLADMGPAEISEHLDDQLPDGVDRDDLIDAISGRLSRALAEYQPRDQVLTEGATSARTAAEALPDGDPLIPGLLHAASLLLAARTGQED
ncbi:hypothetical protein [Kitasatospora phosalacinea]|uniref:Uncharacterized protein n=1 Tax=Kitasatospora phosalacinea TaxID=2065 RepID=A0ABW6GRB6_9ACTN